MTLQAPFSLKCNLSKNISNFTLVGPKKINFLRGIEPRENDCTLEILIVSGDESLFRSILNGYIYSKQLIISTVQSAGIVRVL